MSKIDPVVIGVSGGMDSLFLLDVLHRLGYPIFAAHYNHGIRPEAHQDAYIIQEYTKPRNIPFILDVGSAPDFSVAQSLSIEEAARFLRYRFLFQQAMVVKAQAVIVAHNANDQIETLIMHFLRGTGLDGLKGMAPWLLPNEWSKTIPLVRPILKIWRNTIANYCNENRISSIQDQTNEDTEYFRNRLRHELLPLLNTYIPGLEKRLLQTSELIRDECEVLERAARDSWNDLSNFEGKRYVSFNRKQFNLLHISTRRRLIRISISILKPNARDIDFAIVKRVLAFFEQPSKTFKADIGLGLMVILENGEIFISTEIELLPQEKYPWLENELEIKLPGKNRLSNGWVLSGEILEDLEVAKEKAFNNQDKFQSWMDIKNDIPRLMMKCRQPGDRFTPFGMAGKSIKISDLMINIKTPRRARENWPLLWFGDEIIWVPGYRIADSVKIDNNTREVIHLKLSFNGQKN